MSTQARLPLQRSRFVVVTVVVSILCLISVYVVLAAISLSTSTAYTQNFDGMGIPGSATTASTLPTDFRADALASVRTVGTFSAAGTTTARAGAANLSTAAANGIYSFGSGTTTLGDSDRAVGFLASGTATTSGNLYAQLVNGTGGDLSGLEISYNVEKYRRGSNAAGFRIQMFYSTDGNTWTNAGNNFLTGFGADVDNTGYPTVPGATVAVTNQTLSATIPNGSNFYLAWNYSVTSGSTVTNAQALAVDDISILGITAAAPSPSPTPTPAPSPSPSPTPTPTPTPTTGTPGTVVISQVYGGGGNASATYQNDYVELFNRSQSTVSISGWSLQYAAATGTGNFSSNVASLSGSLAPGQYYLVKLASGGANGASLPAEDASQTGINMAAGAGKVVLVDIATGLACNGGSTVCSAGDLAHIMDLVGYGTANYFEGSAAPGPSNNTTSIFRALAGCTDTDNNGADFSTGSPNPRNTATTLNACGAPTPTPTPTPTPAVGGNVIISQVYGGGGNTGSTLKNDYIELINHSAAPVNLNGWTVQVFSTTSSTWIVTPLTNFTLQPGQYYLIQESQGAGGTDDLPTPDASGTIPVSSTSGKVALVSNAVTLTGACPSSPSIVDFVGYGTTDCFEGSGTAPLLSNTTAAIRANEGCFDTNNNAVDFFAGEPNPHNSSSATHDCTTLFGFGSANPSSVLQGGMSSLTVYVSPGQNPTSTGVMVTADLSSIGGSPSQSFSGVGNTFTFNATVSLSATAGFKSLPVSITDGESRTFAASILLSVLPLVPDHITISQVYGGGGNTGATYTNDFVELYNPTAATVSITGWSLQYGAATGTTWTNKQPIGGYIEPGQYYLVSLASGGANGAPLPVTPNLSGTINMAAAAGKIALVRNSDSLSGGCPLGSDPDIVDFVGYGTTANCHEGTANAPAPSNSTALFRQGNGASDSDQNGADFTTATPNPRRTAPIVELGPWVADTDPTTNGITVPYDASITVSFSEPVDVVGAWYNINCNVTGLHNDATVGHTNDFKTYAITPNTSFQFGEQCTATILKDGVHDQDTDDSEPDTDTLFADYTWSFLVVGAGQPAPYAPSVHLTMGNPSGAVADFGEPLNYLMMKPTYALSYNRDKGTPNWVSWHLDPSWYGTLARVDTFRADPAVPSDWYRVESFDYAGSGFDRGHMTPNADRDNQNRIPINQETYLMSNMVPQSPDNNQGPWANLEADLRTLADAGNELYIVSGPSGVGGVGSVNGNTVNTLANGHVTVPAFTWKVALVLTSASGDDVSRVTCSSRTIAVLMPNTQGIRTTPWQNFLTTVDAIEQLTGYDFYSNVPPAVQACIEAGTNGINPPGTASQSVNTAEDAPVTITLQAARPNNNALTFSIVGSGPLHGSLGSIGAPSCTAGNCTATVTYTPNPDYNGGDSFIFKVNNGTTDSNQSTVSINVTEVNDATVANDDSVNAVEDTTLNLAAAYLTANDSPGPANESSQTLTVTSVTATANTHGSVMLNSGIVSYSPDPNYNGPASFEYQVCDSGTTNGAADPRCATAIVNVTVSEVNDAPVAVNDVKATNQDTNLNFPASDLSANDSAGPANESDQILTVTSVSGTANTHGTVALNSGIVTYSPTANYSGPASFDYQVCDNGTTNGAPDFKCAVGTVNVTVVAVPDTEPPVISCQPDIVVDFDPAVNGAVVTYTAPVGTDNRPGATTAQTAGLASGATFPPGITTNTFTVTDAAGNMSSCSFKVTVALTSIIGLESVAISGTGYADSYNSTGGYPATKSSLVNVLSNGTITLGNSGKVWGNVRSTRAGVNMSGASQVTGNATAGTTVSRSGSATVGGTITNGAPAPFMTLPPITPCGAPYSSSSGITGTYSYNAGTGDLTLSGVNIATLANGNYCFHNVTLTNSAQLKVNGPVTIRLTGTLNASGASSLPNGTEVPSNLRILSSYSGSNGVTFGNSTNVHMMIYAPQTGVSISGTVPFFGTVVGKTITLGNGGTIHYDTTLKAIWPDLWNLILGP